MKIGENMKNKILSLISLILCALLALSACGKVNDEDASFNTATSATTTTSQSTQNTEAMVIENAEPISLSAGEKLLSSSVFKGRVHFGGKERECFVRSAVILNEKLPFGTVMYLDVLDEEGDILAFRKCSGYGFIAADMSEGTPSKFLFYSVMALGNGMFEARAELLYFDDRDRLTAEPTGTLSAYALDGSYSFKGDADDAVSMAGCADSFAVLADRTFDFLNSGAFSSVVISSNDIFTGRTGFNMAFTSAPSKEFLLSDDTDMMNFVRNLNVDKFKAMYENIYNK